MDAWIDQAPCGFVSFKDNGEIVFINQTLLKWLDAEGEQYVGKNIESIFTIPTRIFYNTHLFPLLSLHGKADEIFITIRSKNGHDIPALANTVRSKESDPPISKCVLMPVAQRKKYEEEILLAKRAAEQALHENKHLQELKTTLESKSLELERLYQRQLAANESLLQFGKIISHDLQESIHKIKLFADRISINEKLAEKSAVDLRKIDVAADRLRLLTRALEQYLTIDPTMAPCAIDLNSVLAEAAGQATANRKFSDFEWHTTDIPNIDGHQTQLTLLFFHLFDNAIQFRNPDRKLSITISSVALDENLYQISPNRYRYAEHIRIIFRDNGLGMDMQYKDYVFDMLKKIAPGSSNLGIGLGIAKRVVENHSGSIKMESVPDVGTSILITLPRKFE